VPGFDVRVVDVNGHEVPAGTEGNIVLALPLPPGTLAGLWRDEERFVSSYLAAFPGHYSTGDSGYLDEDGYLFVLGRANAASDCVLPYATGGLDVHHITRRGWITWPTMSLGRARRGTALSRVRRLSVQLWSGPANCMTISSSVMQALVATTASSRTTPLMSAVCTSKLLSPLPLTRPDRPNAL